MQLCRVGMGAKIWYCGAVNLYKGGLDSRLPEREYLNVQSC